MVKKRLKLRRAQKFRALSVPAPRPHSKLVRGAKELQINQILVVN